MFDNALLYNEPGSMIYRVIKSLINSNEKKQCFFFIQDALNLQKLFIEKKRDFINNDSVQNLVCELLICLFVQIFNYEDQDGQYISDSFSELSEQIENEP